MGINITKEFPFLNQIPGYVILFDHSLKIVYANQNVCALLKKDASAVKKLCFTDIYKKIPFNQEHDNKGNVFFNKSLKSVQAFLNNSQTCQKDLEKDQKKDLEKDQKKDLEKDQKKDLEKDPKKDQNSEWTGELVLSLSERPDNSDRSDKLSASLKEHSDSPFLKVLCGFSVIYAGQGAGGSNSDAPARNACFLNTFYLAKNLEKNHILDYKSKRLDTVAVVFSGIAHEFNNILMILNGNLELLLLEEHITPDINDYCTELKRAVTRAASLVTAMRSVSKCRKALKQQTSVKDLVIKSSDNIAQLFGAKTFDPVFDIPDSLDPVFGNPIALVQAFVNIISNSIQACASCINPAQCIVGIRARNKTVNASTALELGLKPGKYVKIDFIDNGPGINPDFESQIFDPYFTTKSGYLGLGLAAVKWIAENHYGKILHKSIDKKAVLKDFPALGSSCPQCGSGALFLLYLPAAV
jgi:nitrogen-specific signal transduction histidine kinase